MTNKKFIMSVTASAAIASAIFAADEVDAASHKVQSGETLWSISQQYNTSVNQLKSINGLSNNTIYPNQVIETSNTTTTSNSNSSIASTSTNTTTYTVKSGDTLHGIASKHNISVSNLQSWNNISGHLIYPGDKLTVSQSGSTSSSSSNTSTSTSTSSNSGSVASTTIYSVKSGDTLYRIATNHGVSVSDLKSWNNLSSDLIRVGQKLSINGKSTSTSTASSSSSSSSSSNVSAGYNVDQLISGAKSQIGTPYVWGGTSTSGFDCSGFIYWAYKQAGKDIARTSTDGYFDRSHYVSNPQPGDLVFFKNTYRPGISHMGIYLGNGKFIHAASSTGVAIADVNDPYYWGAKFDSYKRLY
ncbi:C40 family peptidase [Virgibacillus sediminis]|uniref:LysM peptidoglycan-binding domain-containing protein n=1 Tax=Virgibacillus sediminis TaxID=202260 RepID=A0ABV7A8J7_9BACI